MVAEILSRSPHVARVIVEILQRPKGDVIAEKLGPSNSRSAVPSPAFEVRCLSGLFFTSLFFSGLATRFQVRDPDWDPQTARIW